MPAQIHLTIVVFVVGLMALVQCSALSSPHLNNVLANSFRPQAATRSIQCDPVTSDCPEGCECLKTHNICKCFDKSKCEIKEPKVIGSLRHQQLKTSIDCSGDYICPPNMFCCCWEGRCDCM